MYKIATHPHLRLVELEMQGFFALEEVERLYEDEQRAARTLPQPGGHVLLVDLSALKLQAQEVVARFQVLLQEAPRPARRIALVTGHSVSRMQARRIADAVRLRLFETRDDARLWLLQTDDPAARPERADATGAGAGTAAEAVGETGTAPKPHRA